VVFETIGLLLIVHRWDAETSFDEAISKALVGTPYRCLLGLDWESIDGVRVTKVNASKGPGSDSDSEEDSFNGDTGDKCHYLLGTMWSQQMANVMEVCWSSDGSD
jgi:hypothetical protein